MMENNVENMEQEQPVLTNLEQNDTEANNLEDDFYYEQDNKDNFDIDSIGTIDPIEIPKMEENVEQKPEENVEQNNSNVSDLENYFYFDQNKDNQQEASVPNFSATESELNKIVDEVDASENNDETNEKDYDGASFDDMFDTLYSDVEGANHFISNLIEQKKTVSTNETELNEMKEKLEQEQSDFAKRVEKEEENIRLEKVKCDEYIKTQKLRLQNEEAQFNADVEATRTELNLGEQTLKIANEKFDTEKSQFEKYKELEEEKLKNDRTKLQTEIEQFEKYKELEEIKIKEENSKLDVERSQFDKEKNNALEKIENSKKELATEKSQFEKYKELEEKKLEHESKNLSQSCARFKELVAQFNSGFQKLPDEEK